MIKRSVFITDHSGTVTVWQIKLHNKWYQFGEKIKN